MSDDPADGWKQRLFLFLMAVLLLSGLIFLSVKLFHQISSPTHASGSLP